MPVICSEKIFIFFLKIRFNQTSIQWFIAHYLPICKEKLFINELFFVEIRVKLLDSF